MLRDGKCMVVWRGTREYTHTHYQRYVNFRGYNRRCVEKGRKNMDRRNDRTYWMWVETPSDCVYFSLKHISLRIAYYSQIWGFFVILEWRRLVNHGSEQMKDDYYSCCSFEVSLFVRYCRLTIIIIGNWSDFFQSVVLLLFIL